MDAAEYCVFSSFFEKPLCSICGAVSFRPSRSDSLDRPVNVSCAGVPTWIAHSEQVHLQRSLAAKVRERSRAVIYHLDSRHREAVTYKVRLRTSYRNPLDKEHAASRRPCLCMRKMCLVTAYCAPPPLPPRSDIERRPGRRPPQKHGDALRW